MHYYAEYIKELEDLISDKLLPAYIENCRTKGTDPRISTILSKLLAAQKLKKEVPMILTDWNLING